MRTNIDIDVEILDEAQRLTGIDTKRETVDLALRELVARTRRIGILDLRGRVHWEGDLGRESSRPAVIVVGTSVWVDALPPAASARASGGG